MIAAQMRESPGWQPRANADTTTHNVVDFPTDQDKVIATLKARFALAGHQVHEGSNDDFIVTRWGMSRFCADIGALRMFARVLGVQHG